MDNILLSESLTIYKEGEPYGSLVFYGSQKQLVALLHKLEGAYTWDSSLEKLVSLLRVVEIKESVERWKRPGQVP